MRSTILAIALFAATATQPVLAHEHPDNPPPQYQPPADDPITYGYDPVARAAWINDCRARMDDRDNSVTGAVDDAAVERGADHVRIHDRCEAYLDDYAARYAAYQRGYASQGAEGTSYSYAYPGAAPMPMYPPQAYAPQPYGYGYPGNGYGYAVAAPMVMVPVMMVPAPMPQNYVETTEYVYEDVPVPARRIIPRRAHRNAISGQHILPNRDKRVPLK